MSYQTSTPKSESRVRPQSSAAKSTRKLNLQPAQSPIKNNFLKQYEIEANVAKARLELAKMHCFTFDHSTFEDIIQNI